VEKLSDFSLEQDTHFNDNVNCSFGGKLRSDAHPKVFPKGILLVPSYPLLARAYLPLANQAIML
ncbi:hypothetical protein L917_09826, partial [Phytophthora nicotianae]